MEKGRIVSEHKTNYRLLAGDTEYVATVRGSFFESKEFPCVGDYVLYSPLADNKAVIEEILPRTSVVTRKEVDSEEMQTIVSNVDILFIVMGLDGDFNLNRLERYLFLAQQNQIRTVVLLNKVDTVDDIEEYVALTRAVTGDIPVHAISAKKGIEMKAVQAYFTPDTTAVLLGSSGAGKSTITNWLLQEDTQETAGVRSDDSRGRHTTTSRQLFTLPSGGYLIDTPGMRELGVITNPLEADEALFGKIQTLATQCTFSNCDHEKSAGCAVLEAIAQGEVTERELTNYKKLLREQEYMEASRGKESTREFREKRKKLDQSYRAQPKKKRF